MVEIGSRAEKEIFSSDRFINISSPFSLYFLFPLPSVFNYRG